MWSLALDRFIKTVKNKDYEYILRNPDKSQVDRILQLKK